MQHEREHNEYRIAAAKCLAQARNLKDPRARYSFVLMAQTLFEAAGRADAAPPRPHGGQPTRRRF